MLPLNDLNCDHSIASSTDGDRAVTAPTAQIDRANRAGVAGDATVGGDLVGRDKVIQ